MMASVFDEQRGRLCTVCYHQYSCHGDAVPRILTCGHSFCTGCLGRLLGQLAHGHIRCPTCKGDTLVPGLSNDINKLSKNFGVLDILESIDEGMRPGSGSSNPVPTCGEHEDEPMKVFCIQDDQLICIYCQVYGAHQGHQCQLVATLAEESRKTIRSFLDNLSSQKDSMVAVCQAVNDTAGAVQVKEDRLMYEVTRHFEMLRRKLYQRENQVKILLRNRISAKVMLLDKQKRKLHDLMGKVDQLNASCQAALTGPEYELVQQKAKLEADFHSLSSSIDDRDLRPCTKDDLHCHLDPSMLVQVGSHGILVKEPVYKMPLSIGNADPAAGSASTSSTSRINDAQVSETVGSGGDADRQEGDFEHIEWPTEMPVSGRNSRQQSNPSDVIIIYDDMDLEPPASSGNSPGPTRYQGQQSTTGCCQTDTRHSYSPSPRATSSPRLRLIYEPGTETPPLDHTISSADDDSPDLSELSDMELERPLRSAWTNRGGWSNTVAPASAPASSEDITPSSLVVGASSSPVGMSQSAPSVTGMGATEVEVGVQEEQDGAASVAPGDGAVDMSHTGAAEAQRDEHDPWEVNASSSPRRMCRHGNASSSSQHQRIKTGLVCSVYNCTSANCNFYVHCKNCSRLFCQKCVSSSISARRCYKRPRGHSFMYIPLGNAGNASSNNNQASYHRLLHRIQHGHQRSRQQGQQQAGSSARGSAEHAHSSESSQQLAGSWSCLQCLTVNTSRSTAGIERCMSCGQVNQNPFEIEVETELMTFPPSPEVGSSHSNTENATQAANLHCENPSEGGQAAEITVFTVENGS